MKWQDEGIVISKKVLGEQSLIVSLITLNHGKYSGVVRQYKKKHTSIQIGNFVHATWFARLCEHLGRFTIETYQTPLGTIIGNSQKIVALSSACIMLDKTLPERQSYPILFETFNIFLNKLCSSNRWYLSYLNFELDLLKYLGFGLNLSKCTVTGTHQNLYYLSPKTGCAVTFEVGEPYRKHLFCISHFFKNEEDFSEEDFYNGLSVTGFFIKKHLFENSDLPIYRRQLYSYFIKVINSA